MTKNITKENGFQKSWYPSNLFINTERKFAPFKNSLEVFYKSEWITNHNLSFYKSAFCSSDLLKNHF